MRWLTPAFQAPVVQFSTLTTTAAFSTPEIAQAASLMQPHNLANSRASA